MTQIRFTLLAACVTALVACNDGFSDEVKSGSDYDETESVEMRNPLVIAASARDISPALRDIPPVAPATTQRVHAIERVPRPTTRQAQALQRDPTLQASVGTLAMPTTVFNRDGLGQGFSGPQGTFSVASAPPDTVGDVGLNHYVQAVNSSFAIFNKSGTVVYGPAALNTLWSGFGGGCQTNNDGDPTIRYDKQADRWVISQFSVSTTPYTQCIAVSQTSDPTGAYYRYAFQYGTGFNDYPKMSVWPDGYYISYNMFTNGQTWAGAKVCAMDRAKMLTGAAATQQCFNTSTTYGGLLPSDLDGSTLPPAGSPNYVFGIGATSTTLAMWKFKVDWTTPSNSTFTGPTNITVASYSELCGGGTCITQPGTTQKLDSLADRLMNRVPYRNFGTHQSVLVAHAVTAGTSGGMRWYEIRNPNAPTVHQQGTYAPDSAYRFMGSIAFDKDGNIGMGYNISSSTINPGVRYTGRLVSDALGTMGQGEASIIEGGGAQQTNLSRFGDYSSLNIDPADDCTFWYTTEYIGANGTFNWKTRIASFKFPGCGSAPTDTTPPTTSITAPAAGATVTGSVTLSASASDNVGVSKVEFYVGSSLVGTATAAPYSVSWNSGSVANGSYAITSKAFDAAGNTGTSAAVSVTVSNTTADTTAPTTSITAPAAGATLTGTVTLSASASDNVGVSKVEFYVGSSLVGTATSAPYSVSWNSGSVANGSYSITSKAFDAAGNTGTSAAVSVNVSNGTTCAPAAQLLLNPGFESGAVSWTTTSGVITTGTSTRPTRTGSYYAYMNGYGSTRTDTVYQQITIPSTACSATFSFWLKITTAETTTTSAFDKLTVTVKNSSGTTLATLATYSNLNKGTTYVQRSFDLAAYKGQTIRVHFNGAEDSTLQTSFFVDDTALNIQ